ncbi:flagellar basal-body MS-ring/collar protein FliF [Kushneria marisflavi]|uniref:Flagellar M-ring protein n=1 Tax=Kushneria marisflavi TaxID=157779 RepID=A0A240USG5_9GAMM|nr:flagellar basal-body MS-ring/collar protein FliF [Kushneria marisflavi]ART64447.1 flagellar M-ring protein FliF [Kushneria marisflavi]RKD86601.1 flagellar M-ring protein FliF [Kushneria marisflavi]
MSAQATQGTDQKLSGLMDRLKANPRLPLIVAGAAAIAILVVLFLWARSPDYRVLFSNLSDSDGGVIIARLDQMQVPYRFSEGGQAILIPAEQVEQTRMALASEGLPKGGGVGFELMDGQSFGISQFAEHVNYQRALEGELARSIESIDSVQTARVHLAIPQESVFVRDRRQPSASVILTLYRNRAVGEGQVNAITHLVSASVSNLPVNQVTVVDQNGNLLSQPAGSDTRNLNDAQLKYTAQVEESYRKRIEALLATIVGHSNVRAQVTASIDFSVGEHTQETYDPNQDPNQASVRSIQSSKSEQIGSNSVGGVPGALSNQPAPNVASPVQNANNQNNAQNNQNNQNNAQNGQAAGTQATTEAQPVQPRSSTDSSTTNYEVNRVIRHVQEDTGQVQRLSVAVVVNYRDQTGEDGQTQMVALSDDEMAQIQRLVREGMGYSEARGDSLEVVNAAFSQQAEVQAPVIAWYENPDIISLAKTLGRYLLIAIVAFILWRKLLKPLVERQRTLTAPAGSYGEAGSSGTLLATAGDDDEDESESSDIAEQIAKKQKRRQRIEHETLLSTVRDQAQKDPRMVAMILRGWINGKD